MTSDNRTAPTDAGYRRFVMPLCPECHHTNVKIVVRTDYVIYLRCWLCAYVWSVPKPGSESIDH